MAQDIEETRLGLIRLRKALQEEGGSKEDKARMMKAIDLMMANRGKDNFPFATHAANIILEMYHSKGRLT